MPVIIEPVVAEPEVKPEVPGELDLAGRVTFERYSEILATLHTKLVRVLMGNGFDHPTEYTHQISLEFPQGRTKNVRPAPFGGEGITQDMMTPDGWVKYTEKAEREYAARLVLFRKRILKLASIGYFNIDQANEVLKEAGLPEYHHPKGGTYVMGAWPHFDPFHLDTVNDAEAKREVHRKIQEFLDANGWKIMHGYTMPSVARQRERDTIPAEEMADLL